MDSAPAGATRMGSRSSTRHGGPAQVFAGPVRKWRKVWSPVTSSSPSTAAARVLLYKWNPLTPSTGGTGVKEDTTPEETSSSVSKPVKYIPVQVLIQNKEIAKKAAEEAEAQAVSEKENQEDKETATDMSVDSKQDEPTEDKEKVQDHLTEWSWTTHIGLKEEARWLVWSEKMFLSSDIKAKPRS
ncbi:hypothetical protein R1flu_018413 [Riccia fluitans]|uniref:Uncharacterized protein n=1 Tax=Riccia fluitans TaxID=41844 RepID=A0ABD1ZH36_9MARC